jgi:outer membrane receptor protein involved in Fe transport
MGNNRRRRILMRSSALAGALSLAIAGAAMAAEEKIVAFDLPAQPLGESLRDFYRASGEQIVFSESIVAGRRNAPLKGDYTPDQALALLLDGTNLIARRSSTGVVMIEAPQSGSAAGDGAESGTVEALIVTAQKREEDIQDVPIAISAFTQEQLDRSQVAGGPDLMTQVPNMTFTKTNFTSYSIQLRGIGTQAISATVDNAVAVAFNNTPFIRNRFFEQEFYDLQRVEVLRGPQGTLYGRNATAGVVNLISNKPKLDTYEANLSGDVANYSSSRLAGMLNIPLANEVAALRIAGAWTKREGYATNQLSGNPIDGRDLWSTRVSLRFAPTDALDVNLIWEHFEEDDDRIRSGKQMCKTDLITSYSAVMPDGTVVNLPVTGDTPMPDYGQTDGRGLYNWAGPQGTFSQGCKPASLYSPDSFQTPNGASAPYYGALGGVGLPTKQIDPYASRFQSHDLRVIESMVDPTYKAEADVVELQASFDLTDALTITSETGYSSDFTWSTQDYNRFNSAPQVWSLHPYYVGKGIISPTGVFCDPQIGCSDRLVAMDLATATSRHFSQELRIGSAYDGPFNFSLGANFLKYDTEDKYYVFINSLSIHAAQATPSPLPYVPGVTDNFECLPHGFVVQDPNGSGLVGGCQYMDPNPITSLNDLGHNYFLSRNPYKLISYAVFGESYYQVTDALKITAGLRWTVDKKEAPRIPSWVLARDTVGLAVAEVVEQEWKKPTGRLTIDWKPDLAFTDETMVYASYAHGYKAGGMNPPAAGLVCYAGCGDYVADWNAREATKPKTFDPEYIDAFELGSKNTLLDGQLTLNLAAFYYDYRGYQLSQIVDRSAISQNFDATIWGLEIEADWRPLENLRLGFKGGYENTRVADGMRAIDVMERNYGHGPDSDDPWVVVSPFPTFPSNCVLPAWLFIANDPGGRDTFGVPQALPNNVPALIALGGQSGGSAGACELAYLFRVDPVTGLTYEEDPDQTLYVNSLYVRPGYPGWDPTADYGNNNGEGFYKDLSGNELPNAPDFTATITVDYTLPLPNDWLATLHTDFYYQSEAWTRIFNMEGYDKLKAYTNVNLAAIFTNEDLGWKVMAYVKNVFDRDSITGAFLNSDDTGLTTNVFLTEPRLYGLRVTKEWTGGPWWTGANLDHKGPFPLTVELGGQVQRLDGEYAPIRTPITGMRPGFDMAEAQNRDFDWGDGREVKLTYHPDGSPWKVAAGIRYGNTNNDLARSHYDAATKVCGVPPTHSYAFLCTQPSSPYYSLITQGKQYLSDSSAKSREEHQIVDFSIGRDFGLGLLDESSVSLGMRNAQFSSETEIAVLSKVDTYVPVGWLFLGTELERSRFHLLGEREFEGTGPVLTWEAGVPLLGGEETGRVKLDWSVTGGVLFGKQTTATTGDRVVTRYAAGYYTGEVAYPPVTTSLDVPKRTTDVEVPVIDLSLGLSYEVGRIKVGAGYRWERYSDVLDVGHTEHEDADRTMDGPYFKVSVGFGG